MIGYVFCGSFCTLSRSLSALEELVRAGEEVIPITSERVYSTDTRFFRAEDFLARVRELTGREIIHTVRDAEPLGPKIKLDAMIIAPCTGNTLAKLSLGITDTAATMAAKAHLRADRPLLIALASNDAMSQNLTSIATMLMRKSVYFTPLMQDDPLGKPHSLVADFSRIKEAYSAMMQGKQLRPLFV